jgi:hypothetical protein
MMNRVDPTTRLLPAGLCTEVFAATAELLRSTMATNPWCLLSERDV